MGISRQVNKMKVRDSSRPRHEPQNYIKYIPIITAPGLTGPNLQAIPKTTWHLVRYVRPSLRSATLVVRPEQSIESYTPGGIPFTEVKESPPFCAFLTFI